MYHIPRVSPLTLDCTAQPYLSAISHVNSRRLSCESRVKPLLFISSKFDVRCSMRLQTHHTERVKKKWSKAIANDSQQKRESTHQTTPSPSPLRVSAARAMFSKYQKKASRYLRCWILIVRIKEFVCCSFNFFPSSLFTLPSSRNNETKRKFVHKKHDDDDDAVFRPKKRYGKRIC